MEDDSALRAKLQGCAVAGCHGAGATTFSMDLATSSVQAALAPLATQVGVNGDDLVDDYDPDCSYMLTKVTDQWNSNPKPGPGGRMPLTPPYWSATEIDCFRSYLHDMSN
jgi:hypothetical protein